MPSRSALRDASRRRGDGSARDRGEIADEIGENRDVSLDKLQVGEGARRLPADLRHVDRPGLAPQDPAEMEVEGHAPVGIDMCERAPEGPDRNRDSDFLAKLTDETGLDRLPGMPLSARELPPASLVVPRTPPGDEHLAPIPDDGCSDVESPHEGGRTLRESDPGVNGGPDMPCVVTDSGVDY